MKTIQIVSQLTATAEAKAHKFGKGIAREMRKVVGRVRYDTPQEVYKVLYQKEPLAGDLVTLYHHGTKTCEVWLADKPQVLHVYGESKSDADSINTFLQYHGIDTRYTYKPVNGGFQEVEAN